MTIFFDNLEASDLDRDAANLDRSEYRRALRDNWTGCQHHYLPNSIGGGTCWDCGDTLDPQEI